MNLVYFSFTSVFSHHVCLVYTRSKETFWSRWLQELCLQWVASWPWASLPMALPMAPPMALPMAPPMALPMASLHSRCLGTELLTTGREIDNLLQCKVVFSSFVGLYVVFAFVIWQIFSKEFLKSFFLFILHRLSYLYLTSCFSFFLSNGTPCVLGPWELMDLLQHNQLKPGNRLRNVSRTVVQDTTILSGLL